MAKRQLKQKKKHKKSGFLNHFCMLCTSKENESEDTDLSDPFCASVEPQTNVNLDQREISVKYQTTAYSYTINPNTEIENSNFPKVPSSQNCKETTDQEKNSARASLRLEKANIPNKEEKDELIKTILAKYLAVKRDEQLKKAVERKQDVEVVDSSSRIQKSDFLSVECFSSDSTETIILESISNHDVQRPSAEFPTKSKSAPTTSTAHDSLADICFKMNRFKQQENTSDSYVTCCSEENAHSKKKLELIFDKSSEEILSCHGDSSVSLQYKISCGKTPVTTGSVQKSDGSKRKKGSRVMAQELQIHPSAKGEIGGTTASTASLKWKLIISHHDQEALLK